MLPLYNGNISIYFNTKYHNMGKLLLDFPCHDDIRFYYGIQEGDKGLNIDY